MQVITTVKGLRGRLDKEKDTGRSVGFVPTMGSLHEGHLSLISRAAKESELTVVSIFVNPTQFNDQNDYVRYPREPDKDLKKLRTILRKDDIVFQPSVDTIYPKPDHRVFDMGRLDKTMEGEYRPGHFNGVVQVVTRLFDLVQPRKAYFGEKDFQQLTIIKHMTHQLGYPVEVIACPIVREKDGLAMSSRNMLLTSDDRKLAPMISGILFQALRRAERAGVKEVKEWVTGQFCGLPAFRLEYFEIVDDRTLTPVKRWDEPGGKIGCIAVWLGNVRLIDNIRFNL